MVQRQVQLVGALFSAIFLFSLIIQVESERILVLALMTVKSHRLTYEPLLEALAVRGHEVTLVSPIPSTNSFINVREIVTSSRRAKTEQSIPNVFNLKEAGSEYRPEDTLWQYGERCFESLNSPQLGELRKESFHLIMVPALFNECGLAYAHGFRTSTILISVAHLPDFLGFFLGNPLALSFVPVPLLPYGQSMTFLERLHNSIYSSYLHLFYTQAWVPFVERNYRQKLNDSTIPSIPELIRNVSLILVNTHFSLTPAQPYLPNIIEVGGMHCRPAKALPSDLEEFVNSSGSDGFILFSMGSVLKDSHISEERRLGILSALGKLKQKVIWKWNGEAISNLPPNVMLSRWLPQQDLLGHPKIKLFITHCGFGSMTEAIYHGVPLIGIPMFGDQVGNVKFAEDKGVGIRLDFNQLSEEAFTHTILKIINDNTYGENARASSKILRDQPEKPLERAIFWTEYVMRHGGAVHLKSSGMDLNLLQFYSLDVIGFIFLLFATLIYFIFLVARIVFRLLKMRMGENEKYKGKTE